MVRPAALAAAPNVVGTAGIVDGRWIDEVVYRQAVRNATDSNRRHLLQLYDGYKMMSVRTPYRDLLSEEQRSSYFYIDAIEQWDAVAERFQAEVDKFRWTFTLSYPLVIYSHHFGSLTFNYYLYVPTNLHDLTQFSSYSRDSFPPSSGCSASTARASCPPGGPPRRSAMGSFLRSPAPR